MYGGGHNASRDARLAGRLATVRASVVVVMRVVAGPAGRRLRTRAGASPAVAAFVATFSALLVLPHPAGGQDLGVYAPEPIGEKESGLQMELYKFYSPLYSIPNLSARPPDLVTHLGQINKPGTFGTWPEVYAISASTSPGFGQYDGRTYSARWAARITGQLLVERTNTFTFELDNREGAKLYLDGRLCIDNDWNVRDTGATAAVVKQNKVHLAAGYHNIRVEFFVDSTWTQLRLWYSGPGFPRQVVPANKFFLPDASCCLCACRGGQCRVADYGTGAVDCLWPSDAPLTSPNRPLHVGKIGGGDGDGMTCAEPCEDPGAASGIETRRQSSHEYYGL